MVVFVLFSLKKLKRFFFRSKRWDNFGLDLFVFLMEEKHGMILDIFSFFLLNVRELKDIHFLSFLIKKKIFFFNDFYSLFYFSLKILLFSSTLIIFYFLLCFYFSIFFSIFFILFLEFFGVFSSKFLVANSLKHWVSGKQY